ncbi:hypothetical protein PHYBOEH_005733 [Phytophthora boehmeriae]|uniref:Centrosomal protein of 162 kDa n=1 Tax=Phytophthora boehmeriae TaxID=109152 RepID=A0A8T1XFS9_9STRA|nr:hypothetical protein PHYBOEH_005733 [Phytophthora boehmeriae]
MDKEDSKKARATGTKGGSSTISQATYVKLQKEIRTQDNLIAAFQKENECLMQQLKQVRQDVHYDVHEANEELRKQVKQLQEQANEVASLAGGSDTTSKAQYRAAVEARLEAEAHVFALREELAAVRLNHQQRVNELTLELDRVKKAKVELECRYEGVDLSQVAQEAEHARKLQNELDLCKTEHSHALGALQKKLDWYVENQRLLDDQDEELRRLRHEVASQSSKSPGKTPLKSQSSNAIAGGPSPARSHRRSPNDIRRIQELESRLAEVEEAMRRRHPDSLTNLILASRRADEESKTQMVEHEYQEKVAALSRELEQAHEASEMKLASFRQQQEKLLLQYRRKIKEQEKQLKQLGKAPLTHRTPSKEAIKSAGATTDTEVARVRRFYTDKIKQLERKWETKYRSQRKQQFMGLGRLDSNQQQDGPTYADSTVVIANLQRQIREQEMELKQERARADQFEAASVRPEGPHIPRDENSTHRGQNLQARIKELEERVVDLEAQLRDSESARGRLVQTLDSVHNLGINRPVAPGSSAKTSKPATTTMETATDPTTTDPTASVAEALELQQNEAELAQLRQELATAREALSNEQAVSTEKIAHLKAQATEQSEKNKLLESRVADSQNDVRNLHTLSIEAERRARELEVQAQRVPILEDEILSLRRELALPRTPSMVQYRSLELKVATLEQKHKLREAELKVVLDRALASSNLERLSREHAHRAAIAAKNAEIASFKRQLEEILNELAQLQLPSSSR